MMVTRNSSAAVASRMETDMDEDVQVGSRIPMTWLSDEIMLMIFKELDFISVTRLARTCSRFATVAKDKFISQETVVVIEGFRLDTDIFVNNI